jgi:hypothetical protein
MGVEEFKASRNRLVAELTLLLLDVREMRIEEATADLVLDRASKLITMANDCANERELDKVRSQLGRLQSVFHEAIGRNSAKEKTRPT